MPTWAFHSDSIPISAYRIYRDHQVRDILPDPCFWMADGPRFLQAISIWSVNVPIRRVVLNSPKGWREKCVCDWLQANLALDDF